MSAVRSFTIVSCALLLSAAPAGQGGTPPRFAGLEGLYFERTDDPGRGAWRADAVRCLLPERLPPGPCARAAADEEDLSVRDVPLAIGGASGRVVLRQVHDRVHRITEQWWCLYQNGRRSECWFFAPDPQRTENKLLADYEVAEVRAPEPGRIVLRSCGRMLRPQGAWWWHGKDFAFTVSGTTLRFDHVLGRFYFSRGYDLGEKEQPPLSVSIERPVPGSERLETRSINPVTEAMIERCRYRDPLNVEGETVTCADLERSAQCLTSGPEAEVRSRERREPSFIERGGKR